VAQPDLEPWHPHLHSGKKVEVTISDPKHCMIKFLNTDFSDKFSHFITAMGCWTLVMSISTLLFEPPRGVLFEHHTQAYYVLLVVLALVGAA
jgi:hypothetical protein